MRRRGELRIHLGAAPGVGKTFAMLAEARRRLDRGTDVVVGVVETHGRVQTAALLAGLEVLARRPATGPGDGEMDLDAVLARRPEVVLVDELAHTNAAGSRHDKRWQDVETLRDAGIDVVSTLNVQHLESLTDVVEQITGVRQRETVPDAVVRDAAQIELVDITPEALRRRMAHGNVYPAERVDAALAHYFRPGNLTALRELALLWVADEVDVALRRHHVEAGATGVWETRERVVVALTGDRESETVLRRAARIAKRAGGADLLAVHVLRGDGLAGADPGSLGGLRRLARDLGASFHTVVGGDDVPTALLEFARSADATQLVVGTSRRSRTARMLAEGIGSRVLQDSGPIDVHMVSHDDAGRGLRLPTLRSGLSSSRRLLGWVAAVVLPAVATVLGLVVGDLVDLSTEVVLFLLATVIVALIGGVGPAVLAAGLSGLLLTFFLTRPLYSLVIASVDNVITVAALVVVALLVALVVDRAARRAQQAARAQAEATLLTSFARTVLTGTDPLPRLLEKVREAFGLDRVVLRERRGGAAPASVAGPGPGGVGRDRTAAGDTGEWVEVRECRAPSRSAPTGTAPTGPAGGEHPQADRAVSVDIAVAADLHVVGTGRPLSAADRRLLQAVGNQALLALRGHRATEVAAAAQRRAAATETRSSLLSAVGHDLRTPLTAIKAAAGSLRDPALVLHDDDRAELTAMIEESTDRLTAVVDNLLDSSRLAAGAVTPLLAAVGYDEVVGRALVGLPHAERVTVELDGSCPAVLADVGLLERVVANLVDNAIRHGGTDDRSRAGRRGGQAVWVRASTHAERAELRVVDAGRGVDRRTRDTLFTARRRGTAGDRSMRSGAGLGLSVARGLTELMGGTLTAEDTPGGGLTMVVSLPVSPPVAPPVALPVSPAVAPPPGTSSPCDSASPRGHAPAATPITAPVTPPAAAPGGSGRTAAFGRLPR